MEHLPVSTTPSRWKSKAKRRRKYARIIRIRDIVLLKYYRTLRYIGLRKTTIDSQALGSKHKAPPSDMYDDTTDIGFVFFK